MGTVGTDGGAGGLLGERSDVELLTAYRLLVNEMKDRGMAKPKATTEDIKPEPEGEQPTSA